METISEVTHIAYSDESYTNDRYRSVSVVTFQRQYWEGFSKKFQAVINDSGVSEFKWKKLKQARERYAAIKIIDEVIDLAKQKALRVDVLVWDTQDSRHQVAGRDDIANLQRMYYHLFKNVFQKRWSQQSVWSLFPDENSALDWQSVQDYLGYAGLSMQVSKNMFDDRSFQIRLSRDFQVVGITEVSSEKEPICQIADLFAGIGAYTHSAFVRYVEWLDFENKQMTLPFEAKTENLKFSNSEMERFIIIKHFDEKCKKSKFKVSLKSKKGFQTFDPRLPINFWLYIPQNISDKAPTKK